MKRFKSLVAIFAFSLMVVALPSVASAQWGGNNRNDDDNYGNNRNNRNIRATVQNLKNRSRNFERSVDRNDNRGNGQWGNNRNNNGNLENLANRFKDAADDFAGAYGNGRNLNNSRDEAQRLLGIGSQIDQAIGNNNYGGNRRNRSNNGGLQNEWNQISYDLRVVADVYGYNYNNNRNRNTRNNRSGDWRNRIPFPLPF